MNSIDTRDLALIFGEKLAKRLYELDMAQIDFANRVGISKHTIWDYSSGKSCPNLTTAYRIATELGVSLDWMCGLADRDSEEEKKWKEALKSDVTAKLDKDLATIRKDILTLFERRQI